MSFDNDTEADINRTARDYAVVRLEYYEQGDFLTVQISDIQEIQNQFHDAQVKLLSTLKDKSQQKQELEVTFHFDELANQLKARIKRSEVKVPMTEHNVHAKLPKISIPKFDGGLQQWITFKSLFDSLIHQRNISNVEKLHYLISNVTGHAHDLIKNFPITDANYLDAYQLLHKHFDKKRQIATHYYEKLINCEPVKNKTAPELERVHRTFSECLSVLEKYSLPDKNFMLFNLLWTKLDKGTREAFQLEAKSDDIPKYSDVHNFVELQYRALEMSGTTTVVKPVSNQPKTIGTTKNTQYKPKASLLVANTLCNYCSKQHSIAACDDFLKLDHVSRFQFVKEKGLCGLCLSSTHRVKACRESARCGLCGFSHHLLLHFPKATPPTQVPNNNNNRQDTALTSTNESSTVLFATAKILVRDGSGNFKYVKALLDSASACNFVSMECATRLGLKLNKSSRKQAVNGIGNSTAEPLGSLSCEIKSNNRNFSSSFHLNAFVLPVICPDQPSCTIDSSQWSHLNGLELADPDFARPGQIDMLLDASIYASCLLPDIKRGKQGQPIALNTLLGWIVMGACERHSPSHTSRCRSTSKNCLFVSNVALDNSLKRFWEIEEVSPKSKILSKEDERCEKYFVENYSRTDDGRFVVPLPFVDPHNKPTFYNSREIALKRFSSVERKLQANPEYSRAYIAFMKEYEACQHMEEVEPPVTKEGSFYYIPHHGILRPDSISTPLRVVFDAGASDARGQSLNSTLLPGPKLQTCIFDLLLRFRWHAIVFSSDVQKMYRQILVPVEDANYQRIVWRSSPLDPIRDYILRTVTYGVSSAPFQALRTMSQLAVDSSEEYPDASTVLGRDIYVDDVVSGADSVATALQVRDHLIKVMSSGGFHLRKWTSNCSAFLEDLDSSDLYDETFKSFDEETNFSLKILGLHWQPKSDTFGFQVKDNGERRCTKRTMLSEIARTYDPIGILAPSTFYLKYLMQLLWSKGVSWDDEVPPEIASEWSLYKNQFSSLASIAIPRRFVDSFVVLQLHGFCDASERGYCAVIYFRVVDAAGARSVHFCCAKTKVAPLRKLSIPRLELQAAVLLADLIKSVVQALEPFHRFENIFAWSDSTVALSWIKSCPSKWKTFVANRVSHIQEIVSPECWGHTSTLSMPADVGSRGMLPADLVHCDIWWKGPAWLAEPENYWNRSFSEVSTVSDNDVQEEQRILSLLTAVDVNPVDYLINKFSSLSKLKRVLSYCRRFICNAKLLSSQKTVGPLDIAEIQDSFMFLIKHAQQASFAVEINKLKRNSPNSLSKHLRKLSPFVDEAGYFRVGGRLANANVDFAIKHPLLLSRDNKLTSLIIQDYHDRFMHPGAQTLQNLLAQDFWILSPKRAIRAVVSGCVKCFRAHPRPASAPLMGNLPAYRVNQLKPFLCSAVDLGGPYDICLGRGRGAKTYKAWICVFVCTSTHCLHVELSSELSTNAFLAALKRFVARRGRCNQLVSDQGRNFVGASNYLNSLQSAAFSQDIKFSFNPPGSPHFSGLAEAGIKSVKTHLARVVGQQRLTYEEFYTVLSQIEAMLNSRPITPMSSDPNDLTALTPGHFLTTQPLSGVPEENFLEQNISVLHRWKLIQKLHQDFWRRWQCEYIHTLQQRAKWDKHHSNLTVGSLVLIVNEQAAPLSWKLGRIIALHPGTDKVCRVATVKTAAGEYKRPIVKLCPLPLAQ